MDDPRKLRDIIADQCEANGITTADLAKKTGAPEQYLEALMAGEIRRLPAFPYVRPHLVKIAEALSLPAGTLTSKYKEEFAAMHSGSGDRLPSNRFALPSHRRGYFIGAIAIAVFVVLYLISRSGFFGQPQLTIEIPPAAPSPFLTTTSTIVLSGRTDPGDSLFVNGQHVAVATDGTFSKEYQLLPEINMITFSAKRFLGREVTVTRQVYFDQSATSTPPAAKPATTTTPVATTSAPVVVPSTTTTQ